ncbi:MAG: S41 family peptidase [Longimicrobiales bacterium]|nr:S41 family peptidase [Longimicrobiales bacterium]
MSRHRATLLPILVLGGSFILGGFFLQEGVRREENVYVQVRVFQEVVDRISNQYVEELGEGAIYENAIEGLIDRLDDANSSFIPAAEYENFSIEATEGEYGGVGLEVIERNGWVTVVSPIPGTPGDRAGIRAGDRFVAIAGEDAEGMSVDRAVEILRGRAGTGVDVMIGRPGVEEPIPFTLRREEIKLTSVPFSVTLEGDVGYLPLRIFREAATDEVSRAIENLRSAGARSLILDLRGNPGGLLTDGVDITELFLDEGDAIVETRGRAGGQSESFISRTPDAFPDLAMVVLVDEGSASASEIVAGALQDHDRALIVGAPTYGKGSVQTLYRLTGGNVLRLTTALWYTPVGRSVEKDHELTTGTPRGVRTLEGGVAVAELVDDRPTFTSLGGREILGGGGISPDRWVVPDTLTTVEARAVTELYRRAGQFTTTLFNHVVDWLAERPGIELDFVLDDATVEGFREALVRDGVTAPASRHLGVSETELLDTVDRYIRFHLEHEIALQAFGEEGVFLRQLDRDRQLQAALAAVRGAASPTAFFDRPE